MNKVATGKLKKLEKTIFSERKDAIENDGYCHDRYYSIDRIYDVFKELKNACNITGEE